MKKVQLEERVTELEKLLSEKRRENEKFLESMKDLNTQLADLRKKEEAHSEAMKGLANVLAPYLVDVLFDQETFVKKISDISYESAGEWGDDNYVQCGHNPLDE